MKSQISHQETLLLVGWLMGARRALRFGTPWDMRHILLVSFCCHLHVALMHYWTAWSSSRHEWRFFCLWITSCFSGRGPPRRPPPHVLEQVKSLNQSLRLGHLLCRSRHPDFLLNIIQRQVGSFNGLTTLGSDPLSLNLEQSKGQKEAKDVGEGGLLLRS